MIMDICVLRNSMIGRILPCPCAMNAAILRTPWQKQGTGICAGIALQIGWKVMRRMWRNFFYAGEAPVNKVDFYIVGAYVQKVYFPNGKVCCQYCPYYKYRSVHKHIRMICVLTYEALTDLETIGEDCPLEFTGEITGKKESK